jgi:4-amino-4-deoxy-L-arabinose transferase-like glycosyltransferase
MIGRMRGALPANRRAADAGVERPLSPGPDLWGALFSRLRGFSFAVLHLSTLVLAWAGLLTLYGTLRELGTRPRLAGLGTLLLWCTPVFFVLRHSLMTDVPFVSLLSVALFCYVRWVKRGRTWDLSLGSVAALLAGLIRQPGAALALIPLADLLLARMAGGARRALPWSQGVWLLVPVLGVGLTVWWIHAGHGETRVALEKARMVRLIFAIDRWVWGYVRELRHALMHLGLVRWPLAWMAFGQLSTRALAGAFAGVAVLSGLIRWQEEMLPNPLGVMLTWDALGHARGLIAGEIVHRQLPRWGQTGMLGVSLSGAVGLVAVLWDRRRQWPHGSREPDTVLLLNRLLQSLLFEALWL